MAEGKILVAATSAMFDHEGVKVWLRQGRTTVREGHPILQGREQLFRPLTVDFELPSKQDESPARPGTAKAKAAGSDS